jgi:hypothetical protein
MHRTEIAHNTPEQVREYLREALAIVAELDPPDDLRPAVFTKAAEYVASKQVMLAQPPPLPAGLVRPGH